MLSKKIDNKERLVPCASRILSIAEKRYCDTRTELLAIVHFIKHFRRYFYWCHFLIGTDHGSLRMGLWKVRLRDSWKWSVRIEWFWEWTPLSSMHRNADAFSRTPWTFCPIRGITQVHFSSGKDYAGGKVYATCTSPAHLFITFVLYCIRWYKLM